MRPTICPGSIWKDTESRATMPPKRIVTSRTASSGVDATVIVLRLVSPRSGAPGGTPALGTLAPRAPGASLRPGSLPAPQREDVPLASQGCQGAVALTTGAIALTAPTREERANAADMLDGCRSCSPPSAC